jgi:hypothetical protein
MQQLRNAVGLHRGLLLLWLTGMTAVANGLGPTASLPEEPFSEPAAQEVGNSYDIPFAPVAGTESAGLPPVVVDDALLQQNGIQRLPPADQKKARADGFGLGPGMGMGDRGPVSYRAFWFPSESVKGQAADWGMVGQDFSLACPVWIDTPNMLMLTAGVRNRLIDTDAILPDSRKPYPNELWDAKVGLMYMRQLPDDRMIGGGISLGSASDQPFASINEMNVAVNAMYRMPSGERNAWMFMLMYSPTSEIQFPIPGVSYSYNPSDQLHANIGLPFTLTYQPTDRWTLTASYMLIHTIRARATYKIAEHVNVFGGYDWSNEVYMLRDRVNESDRFFLYDQRVTLGVECPVTSWLTAELTGGYAFNRYSFSGSQWDSVGTDRVDVNPGPFMSLGVSLRR